MSPVEPRSSSPDAGLEAAHERLAALTDLQEADAQAYRYEATISVLEKQVEAYREALNEAHDQLCGCSCPTNPSACIAPEETWGAFALLGAKDGS